MNFKNYTDAVYSFIQNTIDNPGAWNKDQLFKIYLNNVPIKNFKSVEIKGCNNLLQISWHVNNENIPLTLGLNEISPIKKSLTVYNISYFEIDSPYIPINVEKITNFLLQLLKDKLRPEINNNTQIINYWNQTVCEFWSLNPGIYTDAPKTKTKISRKIAPCIIKPLSLNSKGKYNELKIDSNVETTDGYFRHSNNKYNFDKFGPLSQDKMECPDGKVGYKVFTKTNHKINHEQIELRKKCNSNKLKYQTILPKWQQFYNKDYKN